MRRNELRSLGRTGPKDASWRGTPRRVAARLSRGVHNRHQARDHPSEWRPHRGLLRRSTVEGAHWHDAAEVHPGMTEGRLVDDVGAVEGTRRGQAPTRARLQAQSDFFERDIFVFVSTSPWGLDCLDYRIEDEE